MSNAEHFLQLEKELDVYRKLMTQASKVIVDKDVSEYPIMVAHQQEMELGMVIHDKNQEFGGKWSIHASTLEEFVTRQIVFEEKIEEFKANYKPLETHVCVFVVSNLGVQFIFLPVKE